MEDFSEYFNQDEVYFSGSQAQFIRIEDMPFQQAFFSHRKLLRRHGEEYADTSLYHAFMAKLCPNATEIRAQIEKFGKSCHAVYEPWMLAKTNGTNVRSKMYRACKGKVQTHVVHTNVGSYIEATPSLVGFVVSVKGEQVA